MQITIEEKDKYNKYFIYNYLPRYMYSIIENSYSSYKTKKLRKELNVNILSVYKFAIEKISIVESGDTYIISINKNLKYKDYNLNSLINYITYGNRTIKGYNLLHVLFNYISKNIADIYVEWLNNN